MKINISDLYKKHIRIVPGVRSYALAASLIFLLGAFITFFSWYIDKQRVETEKNNHLNEQATSLQSSVVNRLNLDEQILRGASALFNASDTVTRSEWTRFSQQYQLEKNHTDINALGYIQYIPAASLESYVNQMKTELGTSFNINPNQPKSEYAPITYVEPQKPTNLAFLGYDALSEPNRKEALIKARDTSQTNLTNKVALQNERGSTEPGFVLYAAIYNKDTNLASQSDRQKNLKGYVYTNYRTRTFFNQAIDTSKFTAYSSVQIFDGKTTDKAALLFESTDFKNYSPDKVTPAFTTKVFGQDWTYRFAGPLNIDNADSQRSNLILIGGLTISFAIAGFLFLVMLTRARAIVYSKQNEAQQAKDDLLSLASHQLRTPATAVKQYLGMILEGYTGEVAKKQLPALQKAYSSNERQLDTINQILYVAKADAGRLSINPYFFDLNYLIDEIASDLSDTLEEKDQSIIFERSSKKLKVYADEASIRMIVENLISNASKYSYTDATITVKTGINNKEVYVTVKDEGVGIASEDFDKLFKKFSRIDNDLSLQVGGSGIGLYIDKVLIELHGGRIEVESKLGHGTTFTIFLPKDNANNLTDGEANNGSV